MKASKTLWLLPLLGVLAMPAIANHDHNSDRRLDQLENRLDRQHERIVDGVRSGELTHKESQRLRREQRHIARLERKFFDDGRLDRRERRTLRRKLDKASQHIYRLKHNHRYRVHAHAKYHGYDDYAGQRLFSLWRHK